MHEPSLTRLVFNGFQWEDSDFFFIKICPIYIIRINRLKEIFHRKRQEKCWTTYFHAAAIYIWNKAVISNTKNIFSNSGHLEWRSGLSDTIWKGTIPMKSGLILVQLLQWIRFKGECLRRTPSDGKCSPFGHVNKKV